MSHLRDWEIDFYSLTEEKEQEDEENQRHFSPLERRPLKQLSIIHSTNPYWGKPIVPADLLSNLRALIIATSWDPMNKVRMLIDECCQTEVLHLMLDIESPPKESLYFQVELTSTSIQGNVSFERMFDDDGTRQISLARARGLYRLSFSYHAETPGSVCEPRLREFIIRLIASAVPPGGRSTLTLEEIFISIECPYRQINWNIEEEQEDLVSLSDSMLRLQEVHLWFDDTVALHPTRSLPTNGLRPCSLCYR